VASDSLDLQPGKETAVTISLLTISPIVALVGGVLILLAPRLLNYIVAIWLIVYGVTSLAGHI
jgi:general stress protein CsbA